MADIRKAATEAIDKLADDLNAISLDIWSHPEENFQETYSHAALTNFLEKQGFPVERNYVVDTGFRSVLGSADQGPHVAILCEYDALPEIGHACGHNLIAEVGLAAGIGVKAAFEANGKPLGKVTVLGTPAEEGGGGKIDMINANVFKDVDVAMMAHPIPYNASTFDALAIDRVHVIYHGKAAHAAAFPWEGVNALDAAVLCYQNVSCMRQQFKPSWRVHGVIRNGGVKPNIIPEEAELEFFARTPLRAELQVLKAKLVSCFEAAANATGCTVEIKWEPKTYYDMVSNQTVCSLYHTNAVAMGQDFERYGAARFGSSIPTGSTDMGNVSYEVPSIHPCFYIGTDAVNHTRGFTVASGDIKAQGYTIATGKAMALTVLDILTKEGVMEKIKDEFNTTIQAKLSGGV